ncbi:MAG: ATP-dependent Clp protease ATP-binding subunit [Deltaproteobacteria bacterium]|nr:ATP-dependent Clp protease ATP-binding subunit [Deltaproteobacteria bacterium]
MSSVKLTSRTGSTGSGVKLSSLAPKAQEAKAESSSAGKAQESAPEDKLELMLAADLDAEHKKQHMGRIRDSAPMTSVLQSAKETYAGPTAIEPEHLALALLKQLKMTVSAEVEKELKDLAKTHAQADAKGMSTRTTQLLLATSIKSKDEAPKPETLLEVMKKIEEPYAARVREVASNHKLEALMGANVQQAKDPAALEKFLTQFPTLSSMGEELVLKAAQKKLDRAVARNEEIEQMIVGLGKRQLNSMVLTGSPGVGKTALVEGFAGMVANGEIPGSFKNARIFSVSAEKLKKAAQAPQTAVSARGGCAGGSCAVPGAGGAGAGMNPTLAAIAAEVAQAEKVGVPVVLFVDEIHQLAGGLNDIADQLKPYLSRGALRIIGATTNEEYGQTIKKDKALQDRFPEFRVAAPTPEKALEMVLANMDKFADFHGVEIDASAAQMAVDLSKYHAEMENPRAAVDWLDQAASAVAYQLDTKPPELRVLENEIRDTKHSLEQAKTEGALDDPETTRTRGKLTKRLDELTGKLEKMTVDAEKERGLLEKLQSLGGQLRAALDPSSADDKAVGELRTSIKATRKELDHLPKRLYHLRVDANAVAAAVSKATGIDLQKIQASDTEKFSNIEGKLGEKVVGQDHVKAKLANEIKADRAKLRDPKRPVGVHLFAGPTGVGKTELAKAMASLYFGGNLIRFDCTEMQEKHELAKLKGAPPGYVGFEGGSSLAEEIRKKGGRAVLLFDEIEKAHPSIMQLLMQIMDEGRFRDNENREVDCTNVMIVFSSNLGSQTFAQYAGDGEYTDQGKVTEGFTTALNAWTTPDVLNRFTGVHVFNPLGKKHMNQILDVRLKELKKQLTDTHGMSFEATSAAKQVLIEGGFSPKFGGRALNREVQEKVRVPLSEAVIGQRFGESAYVMLDVDPKEEGKLLLRRMSADEKSATQAGLETEPKKPKAS